MAFLKWIDYAIFVATLVFSMGIGLFFSLRGTKNKTTRQFILGDGNMSSFPVAMSLMVTYISGITMLGVPAEVYMYGMQWYISIVAIFVSHLLTLRLVIPSLWKLNITSMNQYFELRYNSRRIRLFATIINLLSLINYLGNVLFVPAVTLEIVADIPIWMSITMLSGVVMVYTIAGGFTAVIWTDVFQSVLMFGGMFAILIKGTMEAGGVASTWSIVKEKGRLNLLDFNPDPTLRQSFWSLSVWGLVTGFRLQYAQATFQRVKATPSVSTANRMFLIASVSFLLISTIAMMEGAVMFAYYHTKGCDPLEVKHIRNPNQLIAKMVRDLFQDIPCLPGLFLAALFSASLRIAYVDVTKVYMAGVVGEAEDLTLPKHLVLLSCTLTRISITMSSVLSASSALFWEDIVKPHIKPVSDKQAIRIAQLSVLLFGGLTILAALGISEIKGPVSRALDVTGASMNGAFYGMMLLGWFIPSANSLGALVGGLVSFLFVGWISFGKLVSSGVRRNIKLEPASTEDCSLFNVSGLTNRTQFNHTTLDTILNDTSIIGFEASKPSITPEPQGLDVLYSLSYKWLLPIGVGLVFIVGPIVSLWQARSPADPSLVLPVRDCLRCLIPKGIKWRPLCGVKHSVTYEKEIEEEAHSLADMENVSEVTQEATDNEC